MINSQIRQFRDSLVTVANTSPLPIEIKRLVLAEVYVAFKEQSDKVILAEQTTQEEE